MLVCPRQVAWVSWTNAGALRRQQLAGLSANRRSASLEVNASLELIANIKREKLIYSHCEAEEASAWRQLSSGDRDNEIDI